MLNDSASQRQPPPRLHTSSSSIPDRPPEQYYGHDGPPERSTGPPSSYMADQRPSATGSYFAIQSPQQHNSASTPSAGAQSAHSSYMQSPGPTAQIYTPRRDSVAPQNVYTPGHPPPPSPIAAPPVTPGGPYYPTAQTGYAQPYPAPSVPHQRPPTREDSMQINGRYSHPPSHQMSPPPSHPQHTPSTPLGPPPTNYARPSAHSQRPPSSGYDHLRRSSVGSVGSAHSRDPSIVNIHHPDIGRAGSVQRTYSEDERLRVERERSVESVSPKTIPRPPPQRESSYSHLLQEQSPAGSVTSHTSHPPMGMAPEYPIQAVGTPIQTAQSTDARTQPVSRPSPGARPAASMTPQSTHSSIPAQPSPTATRPATKKRTASVISSVAPSVMPPAKRIRREAPPVWAQSARGARRLELDKRGARPRPARQALPSKDARPEATGAQQPQNGHAPHPNAGAGRPPQPQQQPNQPAPTDDCLLRERPRNDLVYTVCEWIWKQLGSRTPPKGSVFEIEAKLGEIKDSDGHDRLSLPVLSEAVINKAAVKSKFDTSVMSTVSPLSTSSQPPQANHLSRARTEA
jgi:hypothetical protein